MRWDPPLNERSVPSPMSFRKQPLWWLLVGWWLVAGMWVYLTVKRLRHAIGKKS